jgi:TPR repeat protein
MNGEGIEADPERAFAMYQAMVEDDFGIVQLELGKAYAHGRGVAQNLDEALRWFKLADANGIEDARAEIDALGLEPPPPAIDLSGFGREGPGY